MPTYEYQCQACGHEFERFESMSAKPNGTCPACTKKKAKRKISLGAGFLFKGSGFYVTDYRSKGYKDAAKKETSSTGSDTAKSGKTESKSEGKSASKPKAATAD